jgi:tryptophan synthase alpha chain
MMRTRLRDLFKQSNKPLLSVFFTAGFPSLNDTGRIAKALADAGADMIEVGIPFSDPVADGPTIQFSNKVALDNGMSLPLLLRQVKEVRSEVGIPIILMGYINPVLQYGIDRFIEDASAAGVDGVILPDLPIAEYEEEYREKFEKAGLPITFLISPTTSHERISQIDKLTSTFIYAVSASSTTGAKNGFGQEQLDYFKRLASLKIKSPVMIGFGISNKETFQQASAHAAGAIVGSAFINLLRESKDIQKDVKGFVSELKG